MSLLPLSQELPGLDHLVTGNLDRDCHSDGDTPFRGVDMHRPVGDGHHPIGQVHGHAIGENRRDYDRFGQGQGFIAILGHGGASFRLSRLVEIEHAAAKAFKAVPWFGNHFVNLGEVA